MRRTATGTSSAELAVPAARVRHHHTTEPMDVRRISQAARSQRRLRRNHQHRQAVVRLPRRHALGIAHTLALILAVESIRGNTQTVIARLAAVADAGATEHLRRQRVMRITLVLRRFSIARQAQQRQRHLHALSAADTSGLELTSLEHARQ